jgi:hypothetical protein
MKNFPHQINQIHKLVSAMEVINILITNRKDILDDGIFGYELARKNIYTFRNHTNDDLEKRIQKEMQKKRSNQGARTCARDLRRLFILLKYIEEKSETIELTELGKTIIKIGKDETNSNVKKTWKKALCKVELLENGEISHPYLILLKLLDHRPGLSSIKLSLCLEAKNDSSEEFTRILNLVDMEDWNNIYKKISVSEHQVRNAVKILPALAKQIGDVRIESECYYLNNQIVKIDTKKNKEQLKKMKTRKVNSKQIALVNFQEENYNNNTTDLTESIKNRKERTKKHHQLVRDFAILLEEKGYTLYENPMDCLGKKKNLKSILCEVKTLDGYYDDEVAQVRAALSQLLYYEQFNTDGNVKKIALFSSEICEKHKNFLEKHDCIVVWYDTLKSIFDSIE